MAATLLGERTGQLGWVGVILALISIVLFSYSEPQGGQYGSVWLLWALGIMLAWGFQAYYMKIANSHMTSASIFFYMTATALLFIPVTIWMTDFQQQPPINWGFSGQGSRPWCNCSMRSGLAHSCSRFGRARRSLSHPCATR